MKKILIITLSIISLITCSISEKITNKGKIDNIRNQAKTSDGLKKYLQGNWKIAYLEKEIIGREVQSFVNDTLIFAKYDINGIFLNNSKINIEYFDNFRISSNNKQSTDTSYFIYDDTLSFLIETIDSTWTVSMGDDVIKYKRIHNKDNK